LPIAASTQLLKPKNAISPVLSLASLSHDSGMNSTLATAVSNRQASSAGAMRRMRRA
jgi:L-lactate permease